MKLLMRLYPIIGPLIEARDELRCQLEDGELEANFPQVIDKGIIALQYMNQSIKYMEELEQELDKTYEENES